MSFPFFYISHYTGAEKNLLLDEATSRHIVQVLRMKNGYQLNLTDGKGHLLTCSITDAHKKHCAVQIDTTAYQPPPANRVTMAVSLLKNPNRFEWFLEKATEIGVSAIIPLRCDRTEKEKFRHDRMQVICISAMLQSQQLWLPNLHEPALFSKISDWKIDQAHHFIAHCVAGNRQQLANLLVQDAAEPVSDIHRESLICIGPEGDFTEEEIALALAHHFIPVSLGETRLRTETAGVVAASLLCLV